MPCAPDAADMQTRPALIRAQLIQHRLDALRRRAEVPGQLGLDLGGSPPAAGKGTGEPCGQGWINRDKECHKGQGADPGAPPDDTRRRRPVEPISFNPPVKGPSGAELLAYEWQWMMDSFQDSHGEEQLKRVSDWERSEQNAETGRRVVHQFKVRRPDGSTGLVSSETAVKLLGFNTADQKAGFKRVRSSAQTVAKLEMEKAQLQQELKRIGNIYREIEQETPPEPQISRNEYGRGLEWVMPGSSHAMPAKVMARRVGIAPRAASTPEEAHLMPHERSTMVSHWVAARVAERLGKTRMPTHGSFNGDMHYKVEDVDKRIQKARKRLEAVVAAEAEQRANRADSIQERIDALKRRCTTGYGCGSTCISIQKECRVSPGSTTGKERLQRLLSLARGNIKPRGIGVLKAAEAQAMAGKIRAENSEKQALVKAERKRQEAAAAAAGVSKPKVIVQLRRAKPGGETGPDGHWYPGGAWMSEGSFVGAKPLKLGEGEAGGQGEQATGGDREPRVIRNKRPSFPERPIKPKGEGLPRPTGLKKMAAKNDELFFGNDGYILYPRRQPSDKTPGLGGSLFEAAVTQRMSTDELNWATEQIKQQAYRSTDPERSKFFDDQMADIDDEIARYGGPEAYGGPDGHRWTARTQLTGVDAERYIAGQRFMSASRLLTDASPARQRRNERYRDPRFEDWIVPEQGDQDQWVWGLNNVFRAVRIRRERLQSPRADSILKSLFRGNSLQQRIDALRRKCSTGYSCGATCISLRKECRTSPGSAIGKERLKRLLALAGGAPSNQRGIGTVKTGEAAEIAQGIAAQRSQKALQLLEQRGQLGRDGLIPTNLPFSPEVEARIAQGIKERTIRTGAVNYGGEELAAALLKVARDAPGEAGVNARKALAFMEEAGILVNVAAESSGEIKRVTGKEIGSKEIPWNDGKKLAKMVVEMGLVSDERMEWMRKDNTTAGVGLVRKAEIIRNPSKLKPAPEELRAKQRLADHLADLADQTAKFDRGIAQGWRFEEDRKKELSYYTTNVSYARKTYNSLKESRLNELKWAAQELITSNTKGLADLNSGGFYVFGQKAYVAKAGTTGFVGDLKVEASKIDPRKLRRSYSSHIAKHLPERLGSLSDSDPETWNVKTMPIGYGFNLTGAEKAISVHIHELGHAVDSFAGVRLRTDLPANTSSGKSETVLMHSLHSERQRSTPADVAKSLNQGRGPSKYSLTNREELFAESFTAWVFAPRALKQYHPALHDWVESSVTQARQTMVKHGKLAFNERY
jgi:hypothetical protein